MEVRTSCVHFGTHYEKKKTIPMMGKKFCSSIYDPIRPYWKYF